MDTNSSKISTTQKQKKFRKYNQTWATLSAVHARFQIPPIMGAARSYSVMTPFPIGAGLTEVNFGTALCTCPKGSCYWARRYSNFLKIILSSNMRYMLILSWVGCLFFSFSGRSRKKFPVFDLRTQSECVSDEWSRCFVIKAPSCLVISLLCALWLIHVLRI